MKKLRDSRELEELRRSILEGRAVPKPCITVCGGTGCHAYGCQEVIAAFREELERQGRSSPIDLRVTGCHGFCERGPLVVVHPVEVFYQRVKTEDVGEIVSATAADGRIIERLLYIDPASQEQVIREEDVPFYRKQRRTIFGNNGRLDPTQIEDYLALDGYRPLAKALCGISPEQVIEEVGRSGLRGRGGAGFPTGRKWGLCRQAPGETKYVICNADEGDPGAYMDRSLLEGNPHSILEGMIIGAYAIGAQIGYIYVRAEYPLAVQNVTNAIRQAEEIGLLGEDILGSGFSFTVRVNRGAGAFVCGEETALLASIEGRMGEARERPPFPAEKGLWGQPTNINNVETWANVPLIIDRGGEWYARIGTEQSKGTKIFSLVGKIQNIGLVEVPMGITLREIIFDIGGGIPNGKSFKAIQTGGPSGGCIPASRLDLSVDYESLTQAGSIMGSGGLVVMDETTCMVDVARYFTHFTLDESCGKCTPCREGMKQINRVLEGICRGQGDREDLELLEELGSTIMDSSLCGLGKTAPNPVLSTLRYFQDEYLAHIEEKRCPAGKCRELIRYFILEEKCTGCTLCAKTCPVGAIQGEVKTPHVLSQEICIKCGECRAVCRFDAIVVQ